MGPPTMPPLPSDFPGVPSMVDGRGRAWSARQAKLGAGLAAQAPQRLQQRICRDVQTMRSRGKTRNSGSGGEYRVVWTPLCAYRLALKDYLPRPGLEPTHADQHCYQSGRALQAADWGGRTDGPRRRVRVRQACPRARARAAHCPALLVLAQALAPALVPGSLVPVVQASAAGRPTAPFVHCCGGGGGAARPARGPPAILKGLPPVASLA